MRRMGYAAFVGLIAGAIALAGCTSSGNQPAPSEPAAQPADAAEITLVTYKQWNSSPAGYDLKMYETTDPAQLADLQTILDEHEWTPEWSVTDHMCEGGTTTEVHVTFASSPSPASIIYPACDNDDPLGEALQDLVESWKQ